MKRIIKEKKSKMKNRYKIEKLYLYTISNLFHLFNSIK